MLEEWTGPHYDRLLRNINRQEKVTQDGHPRLLDCYIETEMNHETYVYYYYYYYYYYCRSQWPRGLKSGSAAVC